jgi:phosphatidylglycerophosphate synthase
MLDRSLRPTKERVLTTIAQRVSTRVAPVQLTLLSLLCCVGAGGAAAERRHGLGVVLWLVGRLLDGLDGTLARLRAKATDVGGYLDMLADTVGYAAVPIGVAASSNEQHVWPLVAVLMASFYINAISWLYLAAIAEKRAAGARAKGEFTTIHMPGGLIEGTETIVFFTLMLAVPGLAEFWFVTMAALVALTVVQRLVFAARHLR